MSKQLNRKRKHEPDEMQVEYLVPQSKNRHFGEEEEAEEKQLSKDLFGDNSGFLKSLAEVELDSYGGLSSDSGLGETDSSNDGEKRKPAWHDEEDEGISVGYALTSQNRSIPQGGLNNRTNLYSDLLKNKFESIHNTPKWASLDNSNIKSEELLQSCGHIKTKSSLRSGILEFKKLQNLNKQTRNEGPFITSVEFHPSCTVAMTAGLSGVFSLLTVDGQTNNKLHSVKFNKFPINCGKFIKNGQEVLLGSKYNHFYLYDLNAAKSVRVPLPSEVTNCKKFTVSSKLIAVCGKWGEVHLLDVNSKELVQTFKNNSNVNALTFTADDRQLFCHTDSGEVSIWEVGCGRLKHKWIDDGCVNGSDVCVSPFADLIATGSSEGVVNLYETDKIYSTSTPKPTKQIMNLTTAINCVRFNSTQEILGFSSLELANAIRFLHIGSKKVFSNFPTFQSNIGCVNTVSFSPNSGYVALGTKNNTVHLFKLNHYQNY